MITSPLWLWLITSNVYQLIDTENKINYHWSDTIYRCLQVVSLLLSWWQNVWQFQNLQSYKKRGRNSENSKLSSTFLLNFEKKVTIKVCTLNKLVTFYAFLHSYWSIILLICYKIKVPIKFVISESLIGYIDWIMINSDTLKMYVIILRCIRTIMPDAY